MARVLVESTLSAGADDPDLRLIETLRQDSSPERIALHQSRMRSGAEMLGWGFDDAGFDRALADVARKGGGRLRLTLDRQGRFEGQAAPLPPASPEWTLALAAQRLDADDPWLRLKTTRRAAYDQARAALPGGIDEVIFQNQRGEVCDGTITTLFFDRGQGLRTPPLQSGLLPGVLRAELACREELLLACDLPHVRLWVGNALRGLIPAVWRG